MNWGRWIQFGIPFVQMSDVEELVKEITTDNYTRTKENLCNNTEMKSFYEEVH